MQTEGSEGKNVLLNQAFFKIEAMRTRMDKVRVAVTNAIGALQNEVDNLGTALRVQYTPHAVLLKKTPGGFEVVRIVDTDNLPDEELHFDLVLPIPDPESLPEFQGW